MLSIDTVSMAQETMLLLAAHRHIIPDVLDKWPCNANS